MYLFTTNFSSPYVPFWFKGGHRADRSFTTRAMNDYPATPVRSARAVSWRAKEIQGKQPSLPLRRPAIRQARKPANAQTTATADEAKC